MRTTTTATRKTTTGRSESTRPTSRTQALRDCVDACNETIAYCLEQGGDHVEAEHIRCLIDTQEICTVAANALARESDHADELLEICAEVCSCTADSCAEFDDDAQMKICENACRDAFEFAKRH